MYVCTCVNISAIVSCVFCYHSIHGDSVTNRTLNYEVRNIYLPPCRPPDNLLTNYIVKTWAIHDLLSQFTHMQNKGIRLTDFFSPLNYCSRLRYMLVSKAASKLTLDI